MGYVKRLLIIPGTQKEVLGQLLLFINRISNKIDKIYIVGVKETVEQIGRSMPRNMIRDKKIVFLRLIEEKDWGAQVLRIYISTLPDIIIYFLRDKNDDKNFDTRYFYLIGVKGGSRVASYIRDYSIHVSLGDVYTDLRGLEKAIEE